MALDHVLDNIVAAAECGTDWSELLVTRGEWSNEGQRELMRAILYDFEELESKLTHLKVLRDRSRVSTFARSIGL